MRFPLQAITANKNAKKSDNLIDTIFARFFFYFVIGLDIFKYTGLNKARETMPSNHFFISVKLFLPHHCHTILVFFKILFAQHIPLHKYPKK